MPECLYLFIRDPNNNHNFFARTYKKHWDVSRRKDRKKRTCLLVLYPIMCSVLQWSMKGIHTNTSWIDIHSISLIFILFVKSLACFRNWQSNTHTYNQLHTAAHNLWNKTNALGRNAITLINFVPFRCASFLLYQFVLLWAFLTSAI